MYAKAAEIILSSKRCIAFTGAGISVESGIPPFRGENGLWNKYDPETFDISYFIRYPEKSWKIIKDIFYNLFENIRPNAAHYAFAELEQRKLLHGIITQNIDSLHHYAGSRTIHEFHGSFRKLVCLKCSNKINTSSVNLDTLPPLCEKCNGILKPDAVFFGESIPEPAHSQSFAEAEKADLFILVGTTGEVAPANMIPKIAKHEGAQIIEINTEKSLYTDSVTDIFLQGRATTVMEEIMEEIDKKIA